MQIGRRGFLAAATALCGIRQVAFTTRQEGPGMYGLIGKILTMPGQRDALIAVLLDGTARMPGCISYVVAKDPTDEHAVWITEVWDSQSSHEASLSLPTVRAAIAKGKPMISGFGERIVTAPVGGHGLAAVS
jgi:quinol monooxygenase YgiN